MICFFTARSRARKAASSEVDAGGAAVAVGAAGSLIQGRAATVAHTRKKTTIASATA